MKWTFAVSIDDDLVDSWSQFHFKRLAGNEEGEIILCCEGGKDAIPLLVLDDHWSLAFNSLLPPKIRPHIFTDEFIQQSHSLNRSL